MSILALLPISFNYEKPRLYANTSGNASGTASIDADARCGFNLSVNKCNLKFYTCTVDSMV